MSGAFSRGVCAAAFAGGVAFLFAVACSEPGVEPSSSRQVLSDPQGAAPSRPARADLAALIDKASLPLAASGGALVPVTQQAAGLSPSLGLKLPLRAGGRTLLHSAQQPERWLALAPLSAKDVPASLSGDGSAVYDSAFSNVDVVHSAGLEGLRTRLALRDAASPALFVWKTELGENMRPVARDDLGVDLVDDEGGVWFSVSPARLTDAHGVTRDLLLELDRDGFMRLRIPTQELAYPALVDFGILLGDSVRALAIVPTQIKGRVMVLLDTSGSMIYQFGSDTGTGGDAPPGSAVLCDNQIGTSFSCAANLACTTANGGLPYWSVPNAANPSRMLAAKLALANVVNANSGLIDFGLARYAEAANCANPLYCCNTQTATRGLCQNRGGYANVTQIAGNTELSYNGSCGSTQIGGRVLVQPGPTSGPQLLPWVDFVEDFCSSTGAVGGAPRNPELRGDGNTPLARSIITARETWYRPVYDHSKDNVAQVDDDALIDCRPYALVVMTDGDDTCGAGTTHAVDCAERTVDCNGNRCFDANTADNDEDWRCGCSAATPCTGPGQTCNMGTRTQDCGGSNAQCASGACIDTPGAGSNWRCSCANDAQCGTGMVCNTTAPPEVDCRDEDARCLSGNCYDVPGPTGFRCACTSDAQCPASQVCDVANNRCRARGVCQSPGICQVTEPLPRAQVQSLTAINAANPVKTYVLGMGDPTGLNETELDAMAVSGGTTEARFASSQSEIEAAFADIVADTVKYEICNTLDDNCNGKNDEGLGVYQECNVTADCNGGVCDHGRCACNGNAQCGTGYACSNEAQRFCRPTCSVGVGECLRSGVRKCGAAPGECCVNDASATCTKLNPGVGTAEVCNLKDDNCNGFIDENLPCQGCVPLPEVCDGQDNDCDGVADEPEDTNTPGIDGLVDVGGPCGSNVGRCTPGTAVCIMGTLDCSGDTGPFAEVCNGLDDDCDGAVDGITRSCYTGPPNTEGVGSCRPGTQLCTAVAMSNVEQWGACAGQQLPTAEICNGVDDDCDGLTDNGVPAPKPSQFTGDECCGDGVGAAECGVGQCFKGTWACSGNVVVCANAGRPVSELCDGLDNDCNGAADDIPSLGGPCVAPGACSGTLKCDSDKKELVCTPDGTAATEVCNGLDDDCDGKVDELEDVSVNDEWWGDACDVPEPGHDFPPCQAGEYVCKAGKKTCEGAVKPLPEVCDLRDTDCDGVTDTLAACPGTTACVQGVCVETCGGGEFPCPSGYTCQSFGGSRYCVPINCNSVECPPGASCKDGACTLDATGGAGNAGGAGNDPGDGTAGEGDEPGSGANGPGSNEAGAGAEPSRGGSSSGNGGSSTSSSTDDRGVYGLVTGGGGCACRTAPLSGGRWAMGLSLLVLGSAIARRRRSLDGGVAR